MRLTACAALAGSLIAFGCETQQQTVDNMQPRAVHAAQQRGSFELNCPAATAQILGKEMLETRNISLYAAPERAEYTVGVEGCGKKATYVVVCAQGGTGCIAGGSRADARSATAPR